MECQFIILFQVYSDDTIEDMREEKVTSLKFITSIQLKALFNCFDSKKLDIPLTISQHLQLFSCCHFLTMMNDD